MKKCSSKCIELDQKCPYQDCRFWIDYDGDLNCSLIAIEKNGPMKLEDVGERLGISYVRVHQLENQAKKKLFKKIKASKHLRVLSE